MIREDGTNNQWRNCRKISPALQYDVTDVDSLNYASKINPAYMIGDAGKISVFPTPGVDPNAFKVYYVNKDPVNSSGSALIHSHDDILYFPIDKVYLVVVYAGIRLIHATLAAKSAPSIPVSQVLPALDITATDPTAITLTTISYLPITASTSTVLTSLTAPTYTKPTLVLGAAPTISDLNVTVVPPDVPSNPSIDSPGIATVTIGSLGTEPSLTAASLTSRVSFNNYWVITDFPDSDPGELSVTAVPPDVPTLGATSVTITGTAPTYNTSVASSALTEANNFIDSDEDVELANAKLAEVQALMQDELNEFNQENIAYQSLLQKDLKDADFDNQEDARKIQKYSAEVQEYQAEVGAQVQEYTQKFQRYSTELSTVFQAWQKTESDSLQQYQLDIQANLNEFNEDNAIYQSTVQEAIQNATIAAQEAQKEGDLTFQADIQEYTLKLQKYQAEYAGYTAEVPSQVQEYTQNLQADGMGYQWLQGQYAALKAEYDAAFMIAAPKQQQPAPAR